MSTNKISWRALFWHRFGGAKAWMSNRIHLSESSKQKKKKGKKRKEFFLQLKKKKRVYGRQRGTWCFASLPLLQIPHYPLPLASAQVSSKCSSPPRRWVAPRRRHATAMPRWCVRWISSTTMKTCSTCVVWICNRQHVVQSTRLTEAWRLGWITECAVNWSMKATNISHKPYQQFTVNWNLKI